MAEKEAGFGVFQVSSRIINTHHHQGVRLTQFRLNTLSRHGSLFKIKLTLSPRSLATLGPCSARARGPLCVSGRSGSYFRHTAYRSAESASIGLPRPVLPGLVPYRCGTYSQVICVNSWVQWKSSVNSQ